MQHEVEEIRVPVAPFAKYLRRVRHELNFNDIEEHFEWGYGFLSSVMREHQKTVSLDEVDAFLLFMDDPLALTRLYPLDEK